MNNLLVRSLIIFDYKNKIGKRVDFETGINIITSNKKSGNDVGKSILLKSIYHTLGADSIFDDMWELDPKVYVCLIDIYTKSYYIYRSKNLFKIYDKDYNKLFSTVNRIDLAEFLKGLYSFCVQLPNRSEEKLEITPPAFSYILNYIDQDYMDGTKFDSFKSLAQYANYKENVIYNHFGIFNEEYFEIIRNLEKLKDEERALVKDKQILENMIIKLKGYLEGFDAPTEIKLLNIELEKSKKEYSEIILKLKKIKNNLIEMRNEKVELQMALDELEDRSGIEVKEVMSIRDDTCPTCQQLINGTELRIRKNNGLEDFYIMKDQLDSIQLEVERKLEIKEEEYALFLEKLKLYEQKMNIDDTEVSNVIKHKGYLDTQDNLIGELGEVEINLTINIGNAKKYNKKYKEYNDLKKKANELYEKAMLEAKAKFGLKEISDKKFKDFKSVFVGRGSNKPIATIIWYFNLLKVKYELNQGAIKFPLLLDSPNNVELDDNKRLALFDYIFKNNNKDTQLIVSTLGFDEKDYKDVKINNIIELENEKYNLLNSIDYDNNESILKIIFSE